MTYMKNCETRVSDEREKEDKDGGWKIAGELVLG